MYRQSLIILTCDHGSNMIQTDGKCCVHGAGHYEENLRVPLLLKLPDSPGRREDILVRHIDILPTILEVLGISSSSDPLYDGPGVSILGRLKQAAGEVVSFYSEVDPGVPNGTRWSPTGTGTFSRRRTTPRRLYKTAAVFFDDTCPEECKDLLTEELYDLESDPFEKKETF